MPAITAELVVDNLVFPEGPRWRDGKLYFSDFIDQRVAALDPATGQVETIVTLDDAPSGLGWRPDGTLLIVSMAKRQLCAFDGTNLSVVADLSQLAGGRTNDMIVDANGGAYIGNFGFDMMGGAPPEKTSLIYVAPNGQPRLVAHDLFFPNGMQLLKNGQMLVVAETYAHQLTAFDIAENGDLSNRRVFAKFGDDVFPDGISANAEGQIWVTTARDGRCLCVAEGAEVIAEVQTPEGNTYACMLGGSDGSDLYICASSGFRPKHGERNGRIWRASVL